MQKTNPADKVEQWPIDRLVPYAKNSRTHSEEQIAQIAASIKEWGFTTAVLVDEQGGIIAGHGRVLAARKLGMDVLPVMVAEGWSENQKRAYVLADNQLALNAGWNMDMLKAEIEDLKLEDFDINLLGFDDKFLDGLLEPEPTVGLTDEDAVPDAPETPKTVLGDVWLLGNHRLMCGDSTSIDAVEKLMDGVRPDLIHTDPPYGMNAVSKSSVLKKNYGTDIMGDDTPDVAKDAFGLINGLYPDAKQIWWAQTITALFCPIANVGLFGTKTTAEATRRTVSLLGQTFAALCVNLQWQAKR